MRVTEIKVSSAESFDAAIREGVARAQQTLENVKSAWIQDQEVILDGKGQIAEYRVHMKVSFVLKN
jgi:flavin-binding protein dodecin